MTPELCGEEKVGVDKKNKMEEGISKERKAWKNSRKIRASA